MVVVELQNNRITNNVILLVELQITVVVELQNNTNQYPLLHYCIVATSVATYGGGRITKYYKSVSPTDTVIRSTY